MELNDLADLSLRRLFCDFLSASLLIVMARSEDNIEAQVYWSPTCLRLLADSEKLQHYLNVRKVINDFRARLQEQLDRLEGGAKEDLMRKHTSLIAYDFEAAARLKAWDSFEQLINVKAPYPTK